MRRVFGDQVPGDLAALLLLNCLLCKSVCWAYGDVIAGTQLTPGHPGSFLTFHATRPPCHPLLLGNYPLRQSRPGRAFEGPALADCRIHSNLARLSFAFQGLRQRDFPPAFGPRPWFRAALPRRALHSGAGAAVLPDTQVDARQAARVSIYVYIYILHATA